MHYLPEDEQPVADQDDPAGSLAAVEASLAFEATQGNDGPGDIEAAEPPAVAHGENWKPIKVPEPGATEFLTALWQSKHLVHQLGMLDRGSGPFRHRIARSLTDEAVVNGELAAAGTDVYFACAEYATPANRTAVNAVCACGFWMDFDCSPAQAEQGKGYADKADAGKRRSVSRLRAFAHNLPL